MLPMGKKREPADRGDGVVVLADVQNVALRIRAAGKDDVSLVIPVPRTRVIPHLKGAEIDVAEAGAAEIAGGNVEFLVKNRNGEVAVQPAAENGTFQLCTTLNALARTRSLNSGAALRPRNCSSGWPSRKR